MTADLSGERAFSEKVFGHFHGGTSGDGDSSDGGAGGVA
jgi:hypothetical protein